MPQSMQNRIAALALAAGDDDQVSLANEDQIKKWVGFARSAESE